ncbi:YciI family protein [Geothrix sp. PMB-07]|uniref:YciI family protein n=1 Tax=Geothrix sp. PMB-07 TaxID=3068640 RepID=UPI0027414552|nr:YciI family protein [Geothrix sp. PMB-07]WLT30719.1 YciI family protein [Geothrix sp. PMB-07]
MKVLLIAYESQADFRARGAEDADLRSRYWAGWQQYGQALKEAGVCLEMHGLQGPETASTVRGSESKRQVTAHAYTDTPDQIGGYFVLEVGSQEEALQWAARCPAAERGAVEIRPLLERP